MELCKEITNSQVIEGDVFQDDVFIFDQSYNLDLDLFYQVMKGKSCGAILRNIIPEEICSKITNNFWRNPGLYKRETDSPAHYVGAFHYGKDLEEYLDESKDSNQYLHGLFEGTINVFDKIIIALRRMFSEKGINFRVASYKNRSASEFVMRSWAGTGHYSLHPHEDAAQCEAPNQLGFEIQKAAKNTLISVNICLKNSPTEGNLHYWNIMPNSRCRNILGLTYKGSPYPVDSLLNISNQNIPIRIGDIYFFNGKAIHGVSSSKKINDRRFTISFLMAQLDEETIIYWA